MAFLDQFSSGQVAIGLGSIQAVIGQLQNLQCTVHDMNSWTGLEIKQTGTLNVIPLPATQYHASSEHLVFHCELKTDSQMFTVVVKFHLDKSKNTVQSMNHLHCQQIIANYNKLSEYLNERTEEGNLLFPSIQVVDVCILKTPTGVNLWVEKDVNIFVKFWYNSPNHIERMVGTEEPILRRLQRHIYMRSNQQFTITDLQGHKGLDGSFILCDIEFTNTMGKLGWKSGELMSAWIRVMLPRRRQTEPVDWLLRLGLLAGLGFVISLFLRPQPRIR
jgi:hypothetical protein